MIINLGKYVKYHVQVSTAEQKKKQTDDRRAEERMENERHTDESHSRRRGESRHK
jgi:hypothetical protein